MSIELGKYIHDLRVENGMTLRELAERVDASTTHISDIENGRRRPSLTLLDSLAAELEASIDELSAMAGILQPSVESWMRSTPAVGRLLAAMAIFETSDDVIERLISQVMA